MKQELSCSSTKLGATAMLSLLLCFLFLACGFREGTCYSWNLGGGFLQPHPPHKPVMACHSRCWHVLPSYACALLQLFCSECASPSPPPCGPSIRRALSTHDLFGKCSRHQGTDIVFVVGKGVRQGLGCDQLTPCVCCCFRIPSALPVVDWLPP